LLRYRPVEAHAFSSSSSRTRDFLARVRSAICYYLKSQ
jgi:hypothetical protein